MTYAPPTLKALAAYWVARGGTNLGIVGDTHHVQKGTSYHLGKSSLAVGAYSKTTKRDKTGLSDAASAIDLGKLGGSFANLRAFSRWLVNQAQHNAPGTLDIREIIYSPDGKAVLRWDRERGPLSQPKPGEADSSHLTHTHVSWYRDSEKRGKIGVFAPYFEQPKEAPVADVEHLVKAISRIATQYIPNTTGEVRLGWIARINDYSGRLLATAIPVPAAAQADADVTPALSHDQPVAFGQIIAALGLALTPSEGGGIVAPAPAVLLQAASPLQNAQLTLMGVFGTPDDQATFPEADFTLYRQYHEGSNGAWAPKPDYANSGAWSAYADSID